MSDQGALAIDRNYELTRDRFRYEKENDSERVLADMARDACHILPEPFNADRAASTDVRLVQHGKTATRVPLQLGIS